LLFFLWAATAFAATGPGLTVQAPSQELADLVSEVVGEVGPKLETWIGARPRVIKVVVAASERDFMQEMARVDGPRWASGLAVPSLGLIILRSPKQLTRPEDFTPLLVHEMTHLYLSAALPRREHPLWLEEGMAMYAAGESSLERGTIMAEGVLQKRLIPFAELEHGLPADPARVSLAYAQSYYMVAFLIRRYGAESLPRVVESLARGRDLTQALLDTTGKGLNALSKEFGEEMESRFSWIAVLGAGGAIWVLASLVAAVGLVRRRRQQKARMRGLGGPGSERQPSGRLVWPPPPPRADVLGSAGLGRRPNGDKPPRE
jgi:hypothetical protein